jgi:predicted nucleic acid-binding protein
MRRPVRVYADTSVFGGALDVEFSALSEAFFALVRAGAMELVVSSVVVDELDGAPQAVRDFFDELAPLIVRVEVDEDADTLQQAYLSAQIVGRKWETDAMHVAVATVSGCRAIVSWNFKHIVNFRRIPLYNEVNRVAGYAPIAIHTPPEVASYEED